MSERNTASRLRANLFRLLDWVLETGRAIEIEHKGRRTRMAPAEREDRLSRLRPHPGAVSGDLEELVHLDWSDEWKP